MQPYFMFLTFLLSFVVSLHFLADYPVSFFIYPSFPHSFPLLFPSFDITYVFKLVSSFLHLSLPSILFSSFPYLLNHIRIQIIFLPPSIISLIPLLSISHHLKTHTYVFNLFPSFIHLSFPSFLSFRFLILQSHIRIQIITFLHPSVLLSLIPLHFTGFSITYVFRLLQQGNNNNNNLWRGRGRRLMTPPFSLWRRHYEISAPFEGVLIHSAAPARLSCTYTRLVHAGSGPKIYLAFLSRCVCDSRLLQIYYHYYYYPYYYHYYPGSLFFICSCL